MPPYPGLVGSPGALLLLPQTSHGLVCCCGVQEWGGLAPFRVLTITHLGWGESSLVMGLSSRFELLF